MCDFNLGRPTSGSDARTLDLYGVGDSFEVTVDSPNRAIALSRQPTLTSTPSRVLVCRPNGRLGNTLLLTPLLQELERVFPGAEIDIVSACPAAAEIFCEYPSVRTIH